MSKIVQFPGSADAETRRRQTEDRKREREERSRAEVARLEERRMLLERSRRTREERKKITALTERRIVARNLWEILERLEKGPRRIRKVDVLIAAGKAQEGDSTKHLERYALRPGLPEAEESKRSGRLVQAVRVYVALARKAAELGGTDPNDAELEVLQGSNYLSSLTTEDSDNPDVRAASVLAEALRRMTDRLAQRYNLKAYFEKCERHFLLPAEVMDTEDLALQRENNFVVNPDRLQLRDIMLPSIYKTSNAFKALSICPTVHLGSAIAGKEFKASIDVTICRVEGDVVIEGTTPDYLEVRCIPVLEIDLILGPFGPGGLILPTLALLFKTKIKQADKHVWVFEGEIETDNFAFLDEDNLLGEADGHWGEPSRLFLAKANPCIPDLATPPDSNNVRYFLKNFWVNPKKNDDVVGLPFPPQRQVELLAASTDTLHTHLMAPIFSRYQDNNLQSYIWTDERVALEQDDYIELEMAIRHYDLIATPTVSAEGTLLARLERWMRGDLISRSHPDNLVPSLEHEMETRIRLMIERCEAALLEAQKRLDSLLDEEVSSETKAIDHTD